MKNVIHLCLLDKFIPPFIKFIRDHNNFNNQFFITFGELDDFNYAKGDDAKHIKSFSSELLFLIKHLNAADKIILHGLFDIRVIYILLLQPWLLRKCYWIIWGGDLYYKLVPKNKKKKIAELMRYFVIHNIGFIVALMRGEYELAREWYKTKAKHVPCFVYTSNLYVEQLHQPAVHKKSFLTVLVGNSADSSNKHEEIFELIKGIENIKVVVPLSYGNKDNANYIIEAGKRLLGENFIPLTKFMPIEEYTDLLNSIDVAIFNHDRQQAVGNIVTLLSLGKKVYLRENTSHYNYFKENGIKVFPVHDINMELLSDSQVKHNKKILKEIFSEQSLINSLENFLS